MQFYSAIILVCLDKRSSLEKEILVNKRQRVGMAKALQSEIKSHAILISEKSREIDKLKRELNKRTAEMKKLSDEKYRAELKAKDALREGAILRKKASDLQKQGSAAQEIAITKARKLALSRAAKQKVVFSADQLRTKTWLDKRLQVITEKEKRVNVLLEKYEQQLRLLEKKQSLEREKETIEQMAQESVVSSSNELYASSNTQSLGEINDLMEALDQTISERVQDIDDMHADLMDYRDVMDTDQTVQHLLQHATTISEANEMIRLLFDMLLKARVTTSSGGDMLRQNEVKLKDMEFALQAKHSELLSLYQSSEEEVQRITKSYETKLQEFTGRLLTTGASTHLSEHDIQSLTNEHTYLKSEVDRITSLNNKLYTKESEILKLTRRVAEQTDHIQFLEEECAVFKEIADDLRNGMVALSGSSAELNLKKLIPTKARERLHIYDESDDDVENASEINDETVFQFTSLAEEIRKTGDITLERSSMDATSDRSEKQIVFERLTNPSNFTGSQRNVFQQNLLKKRDQPVFKCSKRRESHSGENMDSQNYASDANLSSPPLLLSGKEKESRINPVEYLSMGNTFPASYATSRAAPHPIKETDVFSRLNNPRRYTGIQKYRSMPSDTAEDVITHSKMPLSGSTSTLRDSPLLPRENFPADSPGILLSEMNKSISLEISRDFSSVDLGSLESFARSVSPSQFPNILLSAGGSNITSKVKEREKFKLHIFDKDTSASGISEVNKESTLLRPIENIDTTLSSSISSIGGK